MSEFIEINGDVFNIDKIQVMRRTDQKNTLGNDSGVYLLEIRMENGIGSTSKAYQSKTIRNEDFLRARKQLAERATLHEGHRCKMGGTGRAESETVCELKKSVE